MRGIVGGILGLVVLTGCDQFVTPPVTCDSTTIGLMSSAVVGRTGQCIYADPYVVGVSHSPRVDSTQSTQGSEDLVGAVVNVVALDGTVLLCPLGSCDSPKSSISVTIDQNGALSYQVVLSPITAGVMLGSGGSFMDTNALVQENYGPGNSCTIDGNISLTCQAATTP